MSKNHKNMKYVVRLEPAEREQLEVLVRRGKSAARKITRARILLQTDESEAGPAWTDARIAEALGVTVRTVENVRRRLVEKGLEAALKRKKQVGPSRLPKLDGEAEAKLVAVCCSPAPEGRQRWTLRLLANRLVELRIVDSISPETVRQTLKKTS